MKKVIGFLVLTVGVLGCGGGGTVDYEGVYPVVGPFPTTLLIPEEGGGGAAYVQAPTRPLLGVFVFPLDQLLPPPATFEFFDLQDVLEGIPDGMELFPENDLALITTSGDAEGVYAFSMSSFDLLEAFTYTGQTFPLPYAAPDSKGVVVDTVVPNLTSGAVLMGEKIFVSTSNMRAGSDPVCQPGTVWIVGYDALAASFSSTTPEGVIVTTAYNPTALTPFDFVTTSGSYRALLVTNSGVLAIESGNGVALTDGSVDVVDVDLECVVASYPLGLGLPGFSPVAVASQAGTSGQTVYRGYTGSAGFNHVYELDLTGLESYLGSCPDPNDIPQLAGKVLAGPDDPIVASEQSEGSANDVVQVVVNHDGTRAYATGYNTGTLAVLELASGTTPWLQPSPKVPLSVEQITDAMPTLNEAGPGPVAVRSGVPGTDFQGPDVFVLTGYPVGEMRWKKTY